jgi:hypothetical protein
MIIARTNQKQSDEILSQYIFGKFKLKKKDLAAVRLNLGSAVRSKKLTPHFVVRPL